MSAGRVPSGYTAQQDALGSGHSVESAREC